MPAIDWTAPSEVQNQTDAVLALVFAFLGVWAHESLLAFIRFDYLVLFAHRIQFKYTMLLYWANRLFAFLLLLSTMLHGLTIHGWALPGLNCEATMIIAMFSGMAISAVSSLALALRAIALWKRHPIVLAFVGLVQLAQWALAIGIVATDPNFYSQDLERLYGVCAAYAFTMARNVGLMTTLYVITLVFDVAILFLCVYQLAPHSARVPTGVSETAHRKEMSLGKIIREQGVLYIVAIIALLVPLTVVEALHLNDILVVCFMIPVCVVQSIIANRVIMNLYLFSVKHQYITQEDDTEATTTLKGDGSRALGRGKASTDQEKDLDVEQRIDLPAVRAPDSPTSQRSTRSARNSQ